jgi:hypothetical protein
MEQSATGRSAAVDNGSNQHSGLGFQAESTRPSEMPCNNTNAPLFDFGSSEWSDFIQANETLDTSAMLPQVDSTDPYIGFDIPFWLGQDQYWDMLHDKN